jgi:glycerophosphoryl diester phosphodiesterase
VVATSLDWLIARPIAHRGLHDEAHGIIENTASAMRAAIDAGYGIETDVQISADGEAMVHHDEVLGRLTEGDGRLDHMTAAALKQIPFHAAADRMMTLGELCDLVGGRVTLLVELKSRFDGDARLPDRVAQVLQGYHGPVAAMSFDPRQMAELRRGAPDLARGIVAAKYRPDPYWDRMPLWTRYGMGSLLLARVAAPQFVAYGIADLPALAPVLARHALSMPILTWVVRTPQQRARAARWADQMIFEGFRP